MLDTPIRFHANLLLKGRLVLGGHAPSARLRPVFSNAWEVIMRTTFALLAFLFSFFVSLVPLTAQIVIKPGSSSWIPLETALDPITKCQLYVGKADDPKGFAVFNEDFYAKPGCNSKTRVGTNSGITRNIVISESMWYKRDGTRFGVYYCTRRDPGNC